MIFLVSRRMFVSQHEKCWGLERLQFSAFVAPHRPVCVSWRSEEGNEKSWCAGPTHPPMTPQKSPLTKQQKRRAHHPAWPSPNINPPTTTILFSSFYYAECEWASMGKLLKLLLIETDPEIHRIPWISILGPILPHLTDYKTLYQKM